MIKRTLAVFVAAVIMTLSLSACSAGKRVTVNGTKIDREIYLYFADEHKDLTDEQLETAVKADISRYTAVNSEFANRGLIMTTPQKSELSANVNNLWHLYGKYYSGIGVSKQTLYKIHLSKQYEQCLLDDYYSEGGVSPVSEEEIKAFFSTNYVAVRFVTGYLFNVDENGAAVDMTEEKKNNTVTAFNSAAAMVNNGTAIEEAAGALGENTEVHDGVISSFSNGSFPAGFFDAVKNIEAGKAAAVTLDNYIFLVMRVDAFSEEYDYYATYRTDCLNRMKGEEFNAVIAEWTKSYIAE